jgi:4-aminobutyrate aminotransferase-like enzyme/Ser/Thr protein kinase RdoA (MazF antagonist)
VWTRGPWRVNTRSMTDLDGTPTLSPRDVRAVARELYGLNVRVQSLPGDRDQNFHLTDARGGSFVLKVAHAEETDAVLEAQSQAMERVAQETGLSPRVLPTREGEVVGRARDGKGGTHRVRLLTYLPGRPLGELDGRPGEDLLEAVGGLLGHVDRALDDFLHPALEPPFDWDLLHGERVVRDGLEAVEDGRQQAALASFLEAFQSEVGSALHDLPRAIIHNDANDYNILVRGESGALVRGEPGAVQVSGLIDFGDLTWTARAGEPAIAMAYLSLDQPDPLDACAALLRGYQRVQPLDPEEVDLLFPMALLRLSVSVVMAAVQTRQRPDDPYLAISQDPIRRTLPHLLSLPWGLARTRLRQAACLPPPPRPIGGIVRPQVRDQEGSEAFEAHRYGVLGQHAGAGRLELELPPGKIRDEARRDRAGALALRRRHLGGNLGLSYREPLHLARGWMQYLWDREGRRYLDAYNNVPHVGHAHPQVVEAVSRQMGLLNTNTRYLHDLQGRLAQQLAETLPAPLSVCYFLNSATEANELALRMIQAATGRKEMIVLEGGYHGHTTGMIDLSPYKHAGPGGQGSPDWVHVAPLPDPYRGRYRAPDDGQGAVLGRLYAQDVEELVEGMVGAGRPPAGFLAESLPSVGGQLVLPPGYLARVYRAVRRAGGLCIADDVQTGYGRLGTHFYGFQLQDVVPDVVVLGKPMGNGHPLAAVVTTADVAQAFQTGMEFFSTFGGNTVSCAAGLAVLDVMEREDLQDHALQVGRHLRTGLVDLAEAHPLVGDVRGSGFFLGMELVTDRLRRVPAPGAASAIVESLRNEGVLIGVDGLNHNVLKIRPPMPFGRADAERVVDTLDRALVDVSSRIP